MALLSPDLPTTDSTGSVPRWGLDFGIMDLGVPYRKEKRMRLPKRIAIALGSLLAIMLAGGAHYRL
jgi:hypothetical protein